MLRRSLRTGGRLAATCALGVAVILGLLLGCKAAPPPTTVPAELIGVWTTDDPRYTGRYLALTVDTITLGTGDDGDTSYPIRAVEERRELRGGTSYAVTYGDTLGEFTDTLWFDYDRKDGGVIWIKHRKEIAWKRTIAPTSTNDQDA